MSTLTEKMTELQRLAGAVPGWHSCREAWLHDEHPGVAVVGNIDDDGRKSPLMEIDTGDYDRDEDALPLAQYYAAANTQTVLGILARMAQGQALVNAVHKAKGRYHNQLAMCDLYDHFNLPNVRPTKDAK